MGRKRDAVTKFEFEIKTLEQTGLASFFVTGSGKKGI